MLMFSIFMQELKNAESTTIDQTYAIDFSHLIFKFGSLTGTYK